MDQYVLDEYTSPSSSEKLDGGDYVVPATA
jgi:hypothetical protein